jgi:hypothetical protein
MKTQPKIIAIAIALFVTPVQANTLLMTDAQRIQSLRAKLMTATFDVSQAMEHAVDLKNYSDHTCLGLLHDQGQSVGMTVAAVADLTALAILMKDNEDELRVLHALRTWLAVLTNELPQARQIINGTMSQCSSSATVNVKGQTLLNILSEWRDPVASLSRRVLQVAPPR